MLNRIVLMGRLTRDPELRKTQSDTPVCSFSLAVDRDYPLTWIKCSSQNSCVWTL